jgi:hypothetical protein
VSAAVSVMPTPPARSEMRKIGTSPAWKRPTGVSRSFVWPVSFSERDALGGERRVDQVEHLDELREHDHPAAGLDHRRQLLHQVLELGRGAGTRHPRRS